MQTTCDHCGYRETVMFAVPRHGTTVPVCSVCKCELGYYWAPRWTGYPIKGRRSTGWTLTRRIVDRTNSVRVLPGRHRKYTDEQEAYIEFMGGAA